MVYRIAVVTGGWSEIEGIRCRCASRLVEESDYRIGSKARSYEEAQDVDDEIHGRRYHFFPRLIPFIRLAFLSYCFHMYDTTSF